MSLCVLPVLLNGGAGYTSGPRPSPSLMTCEPSLRASLCHRDLERLEARGLSLHVPEGVKRNVQGRCALATFSSLRGPRGLSAFHIWDPVLPRRQGPWGRGRGFKAPETTRVGETLARPPDRFPFTSARSGCPVLPAPSELPLAAKPSRSGRVGGGPEPAGPLLCEGRTVAGGGPRQTGQAEGRLGPARGLGNVGSSPSPPRVAGNKVSNARAAWGGTRGLGGPAPRWGRLDWAARWCAVASGNKGVDVIRVRGCAPVPA